MVYKLKLLSLFVSLTFIYFGCESIEQCETTHPVDLKILEILQLQIDSVPPEESYDGPRKSGWFDPNSYFSVFEHLSVKNGYTLDYVYRCHGDGKPGLYSRAMEQAPFQNHEEYVQHIRLWENSREFNKDNIWFHQNHWLEYVATDKSEESYIEFVILYLLGDQFYLRWHFCTDDEIPVCSYEGLVNYLHKIDQYKYLDLKEFYKSLRKHKHLDLDPTVKFKDDFAIVKMCYFTKWGGLIENQYFIYKDEPHSIEKRESKTVIEYNCGIMF